ncbi:MAG: pyridoxamine 5'-phosphate oxidase family protein, partial [Acidimicrobiia bacterium]|nr:pyridoxamine 5'-phosphate oxidase family protein [Acidimicrobiia bacterium]
MDDIVAKAVAAPFGVLGTHDPDRGPHLIPVVFAALGDELTIPVDRVKRKKPGLLRRVMNLRLDPRATLLIDHRPDDWEGLWWARAEVVLTTEDGDPTPLRSKYTQYRD